MRTRLWWVVDDLTTYEQIGNYRKKASALRQMNRLKKKRHKVRLGVFLEEDE